MELGLTWPLQRLLKTTVPYGKEAHRSFCWDAHCITLRGRSSLLLVHCASRYTCVRFDLTPLDWESLPTVVIDEILAGLKDSGVDEPVISAYFEATGRLELTRTHGRREVAFLNRAWESVLAADLLVDDSCQHQSLLNQHVNHLPCRCAAYSGIDTPQHFLMRSFEEVLPGL